MLRQKFLDVFWSKPNDLTENYGWYTWLSATRMVSDPALRYANLLRHVSGSQQSLDCVATLCLVEHVYQPS